MTGWAAFWIAAAVWVACEFAVTLHGIDTTLWQFRTTNELAIHRRLGGLSP